MSLRLRLIIAFFIVSVLPLGALTMYSYQTNVKALQAAAASEADLLAGQLRQRMQLVTSQLSERVVQLTELPQQQANEGGANLPGSESRGTASTSGLSETRAGATGSAAANATAAFAAASTEALAGKVAETLGDAAMLLDNVELRGMHFKEPGRRGEHPPDRPDRPSGSRGPLRAGATRPANFGPSIKRSEGSHSDAN
jgi:hypothetical protein